MPGKRKRVSLSKTGRRPKRKRVPASRTRYSKQTAKVKARVGRSNKKKTLRARVAQLEQISSKHFDQSIPSDEYVRHFGVEIVGEAGPTYKGNSFRQMLVIQGRSLEGVIPDLSGDQLATQLNTRENERVFVTKVRLRGVIQGNFPVNWRNGDGASDITSTAGLISQAKTRVHMIILKDQKPSVELVGGNLASNPLPSSMATVPGGAANEGILENLFQWNYAAPFVNQLGTKGYSNALRRYSKSRFKPVWHKVFELSCAKPNEEFDVTYHINKSLRYAPAREGQTAQSNRTAPLNHNYVVMFCSMTTLPDPQITPGDADEDPPLPPGLFTEYQVLHRCTLKAMTSRTYFTDT